MTSTDAKRILQIIGLINSVDVSSLPEPIRDGISTGLSNWQGLDPEVRRGAISQLRQAAGLAPLPEPPDMTPIQIDRAEKAAERQAKIDANKARLEGTE